MAYHLFHSSTFKYLYNSLFIGNVINLFLFGALTVQLYLYYIYFPGDRRLFKAVVYSVYLVETIYTVLLTYDLAQLLPPTYSPELPRSSYIPVVSLIAIPACGSIVALLTQGIYAYRVRVITKSNFLSRCIIVLIALGLIATLALTLVEKFDGGPGNFELPVLVWSSVSVLTDAIIVGALAWTLRKEKLLSLELRRKVTRLVYLVIGTGILTMAINIITIASCLTSTLDPMGPSIVLSKIYANSMMVFVNNRAFTSNWPQDDHVNGNGTLNMVTLDLGSFHFSPASAGMASVAQTSQDMDTQDAPSSTSVQEPIK